METIEIYGKSNMLIAEFHTYSDSDGYYACATKHGSTKDCLIDLGWPAEKNYIQFFKKAYEHPIKDEGTDDSWPHTTSESRFKNAVMQLAKLPKVAKVKYDGHEYRNTDVASNTTSARIKLNDKVRFELPDGSILTYTVQFTYLSLKGNNDKLFNKLGISNKDKFMEDIYGYAVTGGEWPEFKSEDYAWWHKFAKEMIMRNVTIYINDILYVAPKDSTDIGVSERLDDLKERIDALCATQYKCDAVSSLKKSLDYDSKVNIVTKTHTYAYRCRGQYLSCIGESNDKIFIDTNIKAGEFCKICYGYKPVYGFNTRDVWPEVRSEDYDALYNALCGIVYTNIGRVYINDIELTHNDALRTLSSSQMSQLALLVDAEKSSIKPHIICHETPLKSDAPWDTPTISVSSELKLEIRHKHKVQF